VPDQQQRVASHLREISQGRYSTLTEHMPKVTAASGVISPRYLFN
jgi:hypothetical protein